MFRVVVCKSIWTHPEEEVVQHFGVAAAVLERRSDAPKVALLHKVLSLPFVPYPGLSIEAEGWSCGALRAVTWLDREQCFRCSVADEYPRWAVDTELSFEDLLSISIDHGWVRPERGGGDAPRFEQ